MLKTIKIKDLDLSVRSMNCLMAADIKTVGELMKHTPQQLIDYGNFGLKSLNEIQEVLNELGLKLK